MSVELPTAIRVSGLETLVDKILPKLSKRAETSLYSSNPYSDGPLSGVAD